MFQATDFYPTPWDVAIKMKATLTHKRTLTYKDTILDPSAGKGDLLAPFADKSRLRAIELDPDLQATLTGKGYTLIGSDFLEFNETGCHPYIIMNPPFSSGIKHILHAWEILSDSGRLVCLLPVTVLNQSNGTKTRLTNLINRYGETENLGQVFMDAERKTSVEIAMITLNKPAQESQFNFDQQDYGIEDFEAALVLHETSHTLGKSDIVKTLVQQYEAALTCIKQQHRLQVQLEFALTGIATFSNLSNHDKVELTNPPTLHQSVKELKSRFWQTVFRKTKLESRATSDFKKKFTQWEGEQQNMAFTESNIKSMLSMFWQNKDQIDLDSLCHVFDNLTRWSENCIVSEGWKTNKSSKLNTKVIIPNIIQEGSWHIGYNWCVDLLDDFDKALCILSGKNFESILTLQTAIRNHLINVRNGESYTPKFSSEFFNIKIYKKGTAHIWFKDTKQNDDFNLKVATHRKWIGNGK